VDCSGFDSDFSEAEGCIEGCLPLDLRPKKRAIRRRLTKLQVLNPFNHSSMLFSFMFNIWSKKANEEELN